MAGVELKTLHGCKLSARAQIWPAWILSISMAQWWSSPSTTFTSSDLSKDLYDPCVCEYKVHMCPCGSSL